MSLSTIIHTKNAATTLKAALESVVSLSDEVIVIDMDSSDGTVELAKKYTDKVFNHPDVGYADPARNFGLAHAKNDWILVLDADEEVTPELADFISKVKQGTVEAELQADAYYLPRKNIIFDHWISHTGWWPDHQMRLFRKGTVSWKVGVHRLPDVTGKVMTLPAEERYTFIHHNYQHVSQFITRLNRYTDLTASENKEAVPPTLSSKEVSGVIAEEFFRRFFAEKGIEDGVHGLSLSWMQAFYQLSVRLKQWELHGFESKKDPKSAIAGLRSFNSQLSYWLADWQVHHTSGWRNLYWRCRRKLKI